MFETLAPEMGGLNRVLLSNLWLFGPLVESQLKTAPSTNAMLRTTTALTVFNAGNKENVLPGRAEALVNFRLLPGDTQRRGRRARRARRSPTRRSRSSALPAVRRGRRRSRRPTRPATALIDRTRAPSCIPTSSSRPA